MIKSISCQLFTDVPDFTFNIPMLDSGEVITAKYRDYRCGIAPTIPGCLPCSVIAEYQDFKNDLTVFKDFFQDIGSHLPFKDAVETYYVSQQCNDPEHLMVRALNKVIQKHINQFGRLIIGDMEQYIDEAMFFHELLKTTLKTYEELCQDRKMFREYILKEYHSHIYVMPEFLPILISYDEFMQKYFK